MTEITSLWAVNTRNPAARDSWVMLVTWKHPVSPLAQAQTSPPHDCNAAAHILNTGSNLGLYYKLKQSHEYLWLSPAWKWPLQGC